MLRYVVVNLFDNTPQAEQQRLIAAVGDVQGIKDVALDVERKELSFGINGAEPKFVLLKQACSGAGFELGIRM